MQKDIFESAPRSSGDFAGVFEFDGEAGYFYLYKLNQREGNAVVDALHILSGEVDIDSSDIDVKWDQLENRVGFFLHGQLWAVFNVRTSKKFGGDYSPIEKPEIPIGEKFE